MSGSIVISKDILTSARFRRVAKRLASRNGSNAVTQRDVTLLLGGLTQLWIYADTHIREDNTLDLTPDEIDELVGITGFAEILPGDWLEILESDCVQLPDFLQHNGTTPRKKALAAQRQKRFRDRHKNNASNGSNDDSNALPRDVTRLSLPDPTLPVPSHPDPHRGRAAGGDGVTPETILAEYPPTTNGNPTAALHQIAMLIGSGEATGAELLDGTRRFRRYVEAGGRSDSSKVQGPEKFYVRTRENQPAPWSMPWNPPPTKAQQQQDGNVAAIQTYLARGSA